MELTKSVIFFGGFLMALCYGLPASKKDEVEYVPPVTTYGDQPIVDTGVFSSWDNSFPSNPFSGLFDNLEGLMERMRQQIASLLNKFPSNSNSTENNSPFSGFGGSSFPGLGGIDLSKGNTSSITKVIDGHKVVINETEYKKEDDFGGAFFKVRIIDVKPDSSELTTEAEAESVTKDREDVANSIENEISKSKEAEVFNPFHGIETFDESIQKNDWLENFNIQAVNPEWSYISPVNPIKSNSIELKENVREIPIDLNRDTYINEIAAQNGFPTNPDAEIFDVDNIRKLSPFEKVINLS